MAQKWARADARDKVKLGGISVLLGQLTISWDLVLTRGTLTFSGRRWTVILLYWYAVNKERV